MTASLLRRIPRQARTVGSADLVRVELPTAASAFDFPVVHAGDIAVDVFEWAMAQRSLVGDHLLGFGALLFRGFRVDLQDGVGRLLTAIGGTPMPYLERSTPRQKVADKIYTSTEYPGDQRILPHNENSYAHIWPQHIGFHCMVPALEGGETTVVDCRRVLDSIDPGIRQQFAERRIRYVRNFGGGLGLSWQETFGTMSRSDVEEFSRSAGYELEWQRDDGLCTRRNAPGIVLHPTTREPLWFNHAMLFNIAVLAPETRDALLAERGQDRLPNNTYFEDGATIPADVIQHVKQAYDRHTVRVQWQAGDLLLLDNMLRAHGREPYRGPRRVLVAMANPVVANTVTPVPSP